MKKFFYKVVAFTVVMVLPFMVFAEGEEPEGLPNDTLDTPIDSWLMVLLLVGVLYGMYKVKRQQKAMG